jgi:hypothetical protein
MLADWRCAPRRHSLPKSGRARASRRSGQGVNFLPSGLSGCVLDRADNEFDADTEDDQVEDHLGRDDQASHLAGRGCPRSRPWQRQSR